MWFKNHLNLTGLLFYILILMPLYWVASFYYSYLLLVVLLLWLVVRFWILIEKSRSALWILIPGSWLFLENKSVNTVVWGESGYDVRIKGDHDVNDIKDQLGCLTCEHNSCADRSWCVRPAKPNIHGITCNSFRVLTSVEKTDRS